MEQEIKYFKNSEIASIEVTPEREQAFNKYEDQPAVKNFLGIVTQKATKGGYYYGSYFKEKFFETLESLLRSLNISYPNMYMIKGDKIFRKASVKVTFERSPNFYDSSIHYFETTQEALETGNIIAINSGMTCIPNYSEINQKLNQK